MRKVLDTNILSILIMTLLCIIPGSVISADNRDNETDAICHSFKNGVFDRVVNNHAVILIEDLDQELVVPLSKLPKGSDVNMWFRLKETDGDFEIISIDRVTTLKEMKRALELMGELRTR